jgi:hypothetical protein
MGQLYIIKTNKKTKQKTIVTVCSVTDLHVVIFITNVTKLEFSNYVDWTDFERYTPGISSVILSGISVDDYDYTFSTHRGSIHMKRYTNA